MGFIILKTTMAEVVCVCVCTLVSKVFLAVTLVHAVCSLVVGHHGGQGGVGALVVHGYLHALRAPRAVLLHGAHQQVGAAQGQLQRVHPALACSTHMLKGLLMGGSISLLTKESYHYAMSREIIKAWYRCQVS